MKIKKIKKLCKKAQKSKNEKSFRKTIQKIFSMGDQSLLDKTMEKWDMPQ